MKTILPKNATDFELAADLSAATRLNAVPADTLKTLFSPEEIPEAALAWLAWSFNVDDWKSTWSEARRRKVTRETWTWNPRRGTPASIRRAFEARGFNITLVEPKDDATLEPFHFKIYVNNDDGGQLSEEDYAFAYSVLQTNKNVRSWCDFIGRGMSASGASQIGACVCGCDYFEFIPNYTEPTEAIPVIAARTATVGDYSAT